jgi:hypothetical protein
MAATVPGRQGRSRRTYFCSHCGKSLALDEARSHFVQNWVDDGKSADGSDIGGWTSTINGRDTRPSRNPGATLGTHARQPAGRLSGLMSCCCHAGYVRDQSVIGYHWEEPIWTGGSVLANIAMDASPVPAAAKRRRVGELLRPLQDPALPVVADGPPLFLLPSLAYPGIIHGCAALRLCRFVIR